MDKLFTWATAGLSAMAPMPVAPPKVADVPAPVVYQMVTNEIKAKQTDGKEVEVYRFDPGLVVAEQGQEVALCIRGVKGHDHPVLLEGYDIRGVVHRNQLTTFRFKADKPGIYRLVCTTHADAAHEGPMEAYVVVIPQKQG